jgi:hypothetical protein
MDELSLCFARPIQRPFRGSHGHFGGSCFAWFLILHFFFGMAGTHNNINVQQRSSVFSRLAEGNAPAGDFVINGNAYDKGYYLADGIYPEWFTALLKIKRRLYFLKSKRRLERMWSERLVCSNLVGPLLGTWSKEMLWEVMTACVIMHNMIVEDKQDNNIYD